MRRDYYAVLGITVAAEPREIRQAYRRLARQYSPDVNFWDRDARALFAEIEEAYRVLSDPSRRAMYDRFGHVGAAAGAPRQPRRGEDVHASVQLSFAEAARGVTLTLEVPRVSPCRSCGGVGTVVARAATGPRGASRSAAEEGGGEAVQRPSRPIAESPTSARGERYTAGPRASRLGGEPDIVGGGACRHCGGRGARRAVDPVSVAIPAGVDSGTQVRLPGEGDAGPFGGPRGDLLVATRVADHPFFCRKGDAVHCEVPVNVWEALSGARIHIPTPTGGTIMTIPPGLGDGRVVRLRGEGMPKLAGQGRGDLYVTIRVELPAGIDARTQELVRELERLVPMAPREPLERYRGGAE